MSKLQVVNELHRDVRRNFPRRKTVMKGVDETFQADLVEMIPYAKQNRNFKYILTVIDIFSKYAWAIPIRNKTGKDVANAMQLVFDEKRYPKNMHTDMGKEFYNTYFKKLMDLYKINHYSTFSTKKAAIVERFNRTLKNKMWKKFSLQGSYKWLNILQSLVFEYNNTTHHTIKMMPIDVKKSHEQHLLNTVYIDKRLKLRNKVHKFKLNDYVRISKYKKAFKKGYTPNWTTEVFQINKIQHTCPVTYLLKDSFGNEIKGGFYEYEIQRVQNPDVFLIDKIVRRKGNKLLIKWLGLDAKFNSWINKKDVL